MIPCHEAVRFLSETRGDAIVVNTMTPSRYWRDISDNLDYDLPIAGGMGKASSMALGLALSRPDKKIWCMDGDGSLLMNLGTLVTIAGQGPANLVHFVFDDEAYQTTVDSPSRALGSTTSRPSHRERATRAPTCSTTSKTSRPSFPPSSKRKAPSWSSSRSTTPMAAPRSLWPIPRPRWRDSEPRWQETPERRRNFLSPLHRAQAVAGAVGVCSRLGRVDSRTFGFDTESMNGREFIRRARRYARKTGQTFSIDSRRGRGSHEIVYVGNRRTVVKYSEIRPGLLASML